MCCNRDGIYAAKARVQMTIQSGGFCSRLKGMEALPSFVRGCLDPRFKSAICQRLALAVSRRTTPK